jgi:hypothetical protein
VPKNYGSCRNVRRYIRPPKLSRDVGHVYWFFTKDINDRESIVPIAPQIRGYKGSDQRNPLAHTGMAIVYDCIRVNMLRSDFVYATTTKGISI